MRSGNPSTPAAGAEPLRRRSLVDDLESRLAGDVLSGRYPAGSLLPPERELAEHYSVTRTTVKHTLVRLEQQGLIETRHGVGSRVRDFADEGGAELVPLLAGQLGDAVLKDVFEARRLVGGVIARLAAERASKDRARVAELRAALTDLRKSSQRTARESELEVHRRLVHASGNRVFLLLTNTFFKAYDLIGGAVEGVFGDPAEIAAALEPLVAAVEAGDGDRAETVAIEYYRSTERLMLPLLTGPKEKGR